MISDSDIDNAVAVLRAGGLVAFPTETVYGLGADASNPAAVRKIYEAKGRPADHPVIVHVADAVQVANWARQIPEAAQKLAKKFWPGPLTLILKRARKVSDIVTGGQDTVALRVPSHPVAQQLLRRFGGGIAAPSANRFGRVSATTAEHVRQEFGDAVECVLDGGEADVGIESTIVDLSGAAPRLLRPGWITARAIEEALGARPRARRTPPRRARPARSRRTTRRRRRSMLVEEDLLMELAASPHAAGKESGGARVFHRAAAALRHHVARRAARRAARYAHDLYANLRRLDEAGCDVITRRDGRRRARSGRRSTTGSRAPPRAPPAAEEIMKP